MTGGPTDPVQEGEIVKDANTPPPAFDINAYNATLEVVRRRLHLLEKAREELRKLNEMYHDLFLSDAAYVTAEREVKEVQKKKKDVKAQLAKQPTAVDTMSKIKELKENIKDNETPLSDELMEYYRTSGVTEIEDEEGNVHEFTITVKLKPKRRTK
ncbi:hypothetical protein HY408_00180 [Candidatus Gottesmanbacteria bacterium]|nr:hypothetical protein [Candidatus Gottesmanbacteria bacterium]